MKYAPILLLLCLSSCTSISPTRPLADAASAGVVGAGVYEYTKNPLIAGAAGIGAGVIADAAQQVGAANDKTKEATAYAQGQSDAIKELYWSHQRMKASLASASSDQSSTHTVIYPLDIPPTTRDGINYEPQTVYLPVQTQK